MHGISVRSAIDAEEIKTMKMCSMVLRFGLNHIWSSGRSSSDFSLVILSMPLTIITHSGMREQTDCFF